MNTALLIELHYLPCIDYFISILQSDRLLLESSETYQKQSFRNRTCVLGPNKVQTLAIPIAHGKGTPVFIKDTRIDYSQKWTGIHLKTMRSGYGKAPFFEHYFDHIAAAISRKHDFLWDLNMELLTVCLGLLNVQKEIVFSETYTSHRNSNKNDLRNLIHPKKDIYNQDIISHISYIQTFGKRFATNLSIVDLLFCEGAHSFQRIQEALRRTQKPPNEQIIEL